MAVAVDVPGVGPVDLTAHEQAVLVAVLKRDRAGTMPVARSAIDHDTLLRFEAWGLLGPWLTPPGVVLTSTGRRVAEQCEARTRA